jgi:sulfonate transport system substrate-binding protein
MRRKVMHQKGMTRREALGMIGGSAVAAAWPALWATPGDAAKPSLTLGYQATLWGAPAIVADEEKLFERIGAKVETRKFPSGKHIRDAMVAGHVAVGSLGGTPFIVGVAKGEMAAVGAVAYAGRTLMVVTAKGRGIQGVADLRGKRVASQRGSITDHVFQTKILPKYGLKKDDVQIVNVSFQDHVAALAGKSVEAFAGVEPYPSIAEHEGIGVVLVDYAAFDLTPVLLAANRRVLTEKREALVEFLKGWLESVRIFREQPQRAARIVWKVFKAQGYNVPEEVIQKAVGRLDVKPEFVPELKPYLIEQSKLLVQQRQIPKVPDWDSALVREPLERAMRG